MKEVYVISLNYAIKHQNDHGGGSRGPTSGTLAPSGGRLKRLVLFRKSFVLKHSFSLILNAKREKPINPFGYLFSWRNARNRKVFLTGCRKYLHNYGFLPGENY